MKQSKKLENDKYYTGIELAEYVLNKTKEVLKDFEITEYLEPSAGAGVFLPLFDKNYLAYDLFPEHPQVIKQDYTTLNLDYKNGRVAVGNPPFGNKGSLARNFVLKSLENSDYVAFIMPFGFYNSKNTKGLIYSEDLKEQLYSNRKIHCCLNIYSREKYLIEKNIKKGNDLFNIKLFRRKGIEKNRIKDFDYSLCAFGSAIGKEIKYDNQHCHYCLIKFREDIKEKGLRILKNTNFKDKELFPYTTTPSISKSRLEEYLLNELQKDN